MLSKERCIFYQKCVNCVTFTLKVKINDAEKFQALLGLFSRSRRPGGFTPALEMQNTAKTP